MSGEKSGFEARIFPFFQLLRPPNLFTVPGDTLCGALLVTHGQWDWRIAAAMFVSLCIYCVGLVINDIADLKEDQRERPDRPLPSGRVPCGGAYALAVVMVVAEGLVVGIFFGRGVLEDVADMLFVAVLLYNLLLKKVPILGAVTMGLCRGGSVLVGAAAIGRFSPMVWWAAGAIALYITGVTVLARTETRNPRIPPLIGALIRGLLFIQAGFCVAAGGCGWVAAAVLLAFWPMSRLVASRFYAS